MVSKKAKHNSIETQHSTQVVAGVLKMTCHRSFREVEFLRERWDELVESVGGDLFSSFDWCAIWWKYFGQGRRLHLYIATVGDELVAVLPLFRETIHWGPLSLRVVRMVGSDYLVTRSNVVIVPQWLEQVTIPLMTSLDGDGSWDLFQIGNLPDYLQQSQAFAEALRRCKQAGRVVFNDNAYPNMFFDLADTFEKYLEKLSRKERRNVRRDGRKLEQRALVMCRRIVDKSQLHVAFSELINMHQQHWLEHGRLGHFGEWPNAEQFHRELAEVLLDRDRLVFVEVLANGQLQAAEYGGRFGQRVHWITGCRRREATSRIGFCALVRVAMQIGATQIDALSGYYGYKRRLGAKVMGVKTIVVFPPRWTSRLYAQLFKAVTWLIELIYFRIWFWRLAPWLRRKLPKLQLSLLYAGRWQRLIRVSFLLKRKQREPE